MAWLTLSLVEGGPEHIGVGHTTQDCLRETKALKARLKPAKLAKPGSYSWPLWHEPRKPGSYTGPTGPIRDWRYPVVRFAPQTWADLHPHAPGCGCCRVIRCTLTDAEYQHDQALRGLASPEPRARTPKPARSLKPA